MTRTCYICGAAGGGGLTLMRLRILVCAGCRDTAEDAARRSTGGTTGRSVMLAKLRALRPAAGKEQPSSWE